MPPRESAALLQGTLDMLILRTLLPGPAHGHRIAKAIETHWGSVLRIDHGSLYPALGRLEKRGFIRADWGTSENNRRARFYRLSPAGKEQLTSEASKWQRLSAAVARVMTHPRGGLAALRGE